MRLSLRGRLSAAATPPLANLIDALHGWGTTPEERAAELPCDALMPDGRVADRAVGVDAPPAAAFRWLCQLRAAPYSYDWIDNFGRQSPRHLIPGLDDLHPGQRFMAIFRLVSFEPDEQLTIRTPKVVVTYRVTPAGSGQSRLHMRVRWKFYGPLLTPLDLIMSRKQLLTLSELARRVPEASAAGRPRPGSRAPSARGRG